MQLPKSYVAEKIQRKYSLFGTFPNAFFIFQKKFLYVFDDVYILGKHLISWLKTTLRKKLFLKNNFGGLKSEASSCLEGNGKILKLGYTKCSCRKPLGRELIGWLKFSPRQRKRREEGRWLIGWLKSLLQQRCVSDLGRESIGWLKVWGRERWVREAGRLSSGWLNSSNIIKWDRIGERIQWVQFIKQ